MNKRDLVRRASRQAQVPQPKVEEILDSFLETIQQCLQTGTPVKLRNFGRFEIREREARLWRSPLTGELIKVPPKRSVLFHPAPAFKEHVQ